MTIVSDCSLEASKDVINQPEIPTSVVVNGGEPEEMIPKINDSSKKHKRNKKKKAGPFSFFRAALVALRTTDNKKKSAPTNPDEVVNDNSNSNDFDGNWKKIVGSMRPFHLQQDTQSPPPSLPPPSPERSLTDESFHHQPQSFPPSPSFSSSGTMSQYASASNLQALVDEEEEEGVDPDVVFDALCGDEMIDSKAEEFIAQFYQQIKIDKHHHYRGKSIQF